MMDENILNILHNSKSIGSQTSDNVKEDYHNEGSAVTEEDILFSKKMEEESSLEEFAIFNEKLDYNKVDHAIFKKDKKGNITYDKYLIVTRQYIFIFSLDFFRLKFKDKFNHSNLFKNKFLLKISKNWIDKIEPHLYLGNWGFIFTVKNPQSNLEYQFSTHDFNLNIKEYFKLRKALIDEWDVSEAQIQKSEMEKAKIAKRNIAILWFIIVILGNLFFLYGIDFFTTNAGDLSQMLPTLIIARNILQIVANITAVIFGIYMIHEFNEANGNIKNDIFKKCGNLLGVLGLVYFLIATGIVIAYSYI